MTTTTRAILIASLFACGVADAWAQTTTTPASSRPVGRASIFGMTSHTTDADGGSWSENALNLSFTLHPVENEDRPYDYGVDLRHSVYSGVGRPSRTSLYEVFAGATVGDRSLWVRGGNMWLNDLGALGSIEGGLVEYRQPRDDAEEGRVRVGAFGGLEPDILHVGHAQEVRKFGGYVTYEGKDARRDTLGYVLVRNAGLTERSVVTTTNYVPIGSKVFVYQAAELDVSRPAGQANRGLTYLFTTGRVIPSEHVDLQAQYQRGRSIDARGLVDAITTGQPLTQQAVAGLLYESVGGRASVNLPGSSIGSPTVYGGYYRDRNDERTPAVDRVIVGAQLANVAGRGIDITATESRFGRPSGAFHSRYVSIGKQLNDRLYVSGDYSTSLAIVRFTPSSGITVETRPRTVRWSAMASANLTRTLGLLAVAERTRDDTYDDVRVLSGVTYRIR